MNAAARIGIEQLIGENRLERVPVDTHITTQLQGHAARHVQSAALALGTTFEAAAVLASGFGERPIVDAAADLRLVRNSNQYRGEDIRPDDAQDALDIATELLAAFEAPLAQIVTSQ